MTRLSPHPPHQELDGIVCQPLSACIGAEIRGLDLAGPLEEETKRLVSQLLQEHQVLFFRKQRLDPQTLKAFARQFGSLDVHAFGRHLEGDPEVGLLDQREPERDGANRWHTDSTFMPHPPRAAMLSAVQLPEVGGDTCWASTIAAYDRLSPALQRMLCKLTATHDVTGPLERAVAGGHSIGSIREIQAQWPPLSHPVVCRHPESGKRMLFVNSNFTTRIDGLPESESDALLRFLFEHIRTPELQCRFRWEEGSVALWDNLCTQHYANADYRVRRIMHRVSVAGRWRPS